MDAFKARFRRFCSLLRKRGRRADEAEDLVQEAYVRLLTYIHRGEKVLETEAFLARTVMNLDVDHSRRERARTFESLVPEDLPLIDEKPGPEEDLASEQYVRRTGRTLDEAVGEKTRTAFFMHCLEGMTYEEIGAQLQMSGRSVERHIAKAVAVLSLERRPRP
jgi:RNA polymerase sigma factor (sigma-70 family)